MLVAIPLIVNADDFGFSTGVNRGVIECLERGLVRSATIMVNTPGSEEAIAYAARHPEHGFGLHLNLAWGRPLTRRVPTLCRPDGAFLPSPSLMWRLSTGRVDADELEAEIGAQIGALTSRGVAPTHVDSHRHFHVFKSVHVAVTKVAATYGIRRFRLPADSWISRARYDWRACAMRMFCRGLRGHLQRHRLLHPAFFYGNVMMGAAFTGAHLVGVLRHLPSGCGEIMVHPGRPEHDFAQIDPYVEWRAREIDVLGSEAVREAITAGDRELSDYRSLTTLSTG